MLAPLMRSSNGRPGGIHTLRIFRLMLQPNPFLPIYVAPLTLMLLAQLIHRPLHLLLAALLLSTSLSAAPATFPDDIASVAKGPCLLDSCRLVGSSKVAVQLKEFSPAAYHRLVEQNAGLSIKTTQVKHLDFELIYDKLKSTTPNDIVSCR